MKKIILPATCAAILLSGCATQHPPMSREEYLATTTRTYPNKTKEDIFGAAEKLFRLADGDDFTFTYTEDSMDAQRKWSFYVVLAAGFGQDNWRITTKETDKGVKAHVQATSQAQGIAPMMAADGTNQSAYATTQPLVGAPVTGNTLYNLFWARMDYLLGQRPDWVTCEQSNQQLKEGKTWGHNAPLCDSLTVKDIDPTKPKETMKQDNQDID